MRCWSPLRIFGMPEHTIACFEKGLHVYCEKEMSNSLEAAKSMVLAGRKAGKLLQIGHQRRSNPRYIYCNDKIIKEANLLNRITNISGQWHRSRAGCVDLELAERHRDSEGNSQEIWLRRHVLSSGIGDGTRVWVAAPLSISGRIRSMFTVGSSTMLCRVLGHGQWRCGLLERS